MTFRIGQFVSSAENDFGLGKIVDLIHSKVIIQYFDSPAQEEQLTVTVAKNSVTEKLLYPHTRVYHFDTDRFIWRTGRVISPNESLYTIRFPNKQDQLVNEKDLFVRWSRPIEDPIFYLSSRNFETPFFHNGRFEYVRSLLEQRRFSAGLTALLSSCIELEWHQVEIVRRVLTDPVQRYLLADEVGLGKTIEAGILIRQHVLDQPSRHFVLVIVPDHLIEQWREELTDKFLLEEFLDNSIHILSHKDCVRIGEQGKQATMLVVDEAHHIASKVSEQNIKGDAVYQKIEELASHVSRILLLSATPALYNEICFLAMLHLLDPLIYSIETFEAFREKVNKRQEIAEIFHNFNCGTPSFFLSEYAEDLKTNFPLDSRLLDLVKELTPYLEFGADEDDLKRLQLIQSIRTHINETYKLHRRMLRSRRTGEIEEVLVTGRSGVKVIRSEERGLNNVDELIDKWRVEASLWCQSNKGHESDFIQLFQILLQSFFTGTGILENLINLRLGHENSENNYFNNDDYEFINNTPLFEDEHEILESIFAEISINKEIGSGQWTTIVGFLEQNIRSSIRTVVFIDHAVTADRVFEKLSERFSKKIVRHTVSDNGPKADWYRFKEDPDCYVLICDRQGEEGLNLQGGHAVILHFDLPLTPNRLEQRIGRLDRYGSGDAVCSYVPVYNGSLYLQNWLDFLAEGFQLFDRSIASLQYLIEDEMGIFWDHVFTKGVNAFKEATKSFGGAEGKIEQEIQKMHKQDELDSLEVLESDGENVWFDNLIDGDSEWQKIQRNAEQWFVSKLMFGARSEPGTDKKILRYQHLPRTITPVTDIMDRFYGVVDVSAPRYNPYQPVTYPMSYHRLTALNKKVHVARIGEPFIEAMTEYIRWDDRGICFAMWRYKPGIEVGDYFKVFFRFDFIVAVDMERIPDFVATTQKVPSKEVVNVLQRKGDSVFPPFLKTIWVNEHLEYIDDENLLSLLNEPYSQREDVDNGRDYNLNTERWQYVTDEFDDISWKKTCTAVFAKASKYLQEATDLKDNVEEYALKTEQLDAVKFEQLRSRIALSGNVTKSTEVEQLEFEEQVSKLTIKGIREPSIRCDSLGTIFLSANNPYAKKK